MLRIYLKSNSRSCKVIYAVNQTFCLSLFWFTYDETLQKEI